MDGREGSNVAADGGDAGATSGRSTPLVSMRWREAVFLHWSMARERVAERVPAAVEVATYGGDAWVSVVGVAMANVSPRGVPVGRSFPQLNVRTYVERDGVRGVYFFSLDAADGLAAFVARRLFGLPYYRADVELRRRGPERRLRSRRRTRGALPATFEADYRPDGDPFEPGAGTLEAFLVENYRFFTAGRGGLYYGDVDHPPWRLRAASAAVHANTLFEANGFDRPAADPLAHVADGLDVTAGRIHRAGRPP